MSKKVKVCVDDKIFIIFYDFYWNFGHATFFAGDEFFAKIIQTNSVLNSVPISGLVRTRQKARNDAKPSIELNSLLAPAFQKFDPAQLLLWATTLTFRGKMFLFKNNQEKIKFIYSTYQHFRR